MHIVYIFTYPYSLKIWNNSGHLDRELKHFKKLNEIYNIKFTLITYGDISDRELVDETFIDVIPIYEIIKKTKYNFFNLIKSFLIPYELKKLRLEHDLIVQNQLMGAWVSIFYKIITRKKFIMRTGYDMLEFAKKDNKNFLKIIFYYLLSLLAYISSDIYQVTSNSDLNLLKKRFKFLNQQKIKLRKNWSTAYISKNFEHRNKIKLLSIGRLEYQKNYEHLIRSLAKTEFELDIFGEGSLINDLSRLSKELDVSVNFLGTKNNTDILNIMQDYKYFVTTSLFEGNPKTVLEAMGGGCVVLASNIKNHEEIIVDGKTGFLFNLNDNSLKNIINKLGKNEKLEYEISNNANKSILLNNSLERLCELEYKDFSKH